VHALDRPGRGHAGAVASARQTEVGELHDPVHADQDVLWRDVAVDHRPRLSVRVLALVRERERAQHLDPDPGHQRPRRLLVHAREGPQPAPDIEPLDPLHHQEEGAVLVPIEVVDLDDVRVLQLADHPGLFHEHRDEVRLGLVLGQDLLDRHPSGEPSRTMGHTTPHRRHATLADGFE
jgi:hypothetical protein